MKRKYVENEFGARTQCWIDKKLIWHYDENCSTLAVFFYDEMDILIETSILNLKEKTSKTSSRWPEWKWDNSGIKLEEIDQHTLAVWMKNTERDAMKIPSVFFSGQYLGGSADWVADVEKAIAFKENEHVDL